MLHIYHCLNSFILCMNQTYHDKTSLVVERKQIHCEAAVELIGDYVAQAKWVLRPLVKLGFVGICSGGSQVWSLTQFFHCFAITHRLTYLPNSIYPGTAG